tara:strand:+ start:1397 stop:1588 length:192 start_codon:yes stop_codon:yes gene_type:complete
MSETIEEMRIRVIKIALKKHSCFVVAAAKLEITGKTLYNYRKKLGLEIKDYGKTHNKIKKNKE